MALILYQILKLKKIIKMKKHIFIAISALILHSCKVQKTNIEQPKNEVKAPSMNATFFNKINTPSTFTQVKINSKINAQTGSFLPPIDATIYIENGSKIWMNMSALFLNVARGIATPAGIQGYEKWNKTYIESDFSYLNKLLNINFLNYNALQNLLLGKTFVPTNEQDFSLTKVGDGYALYSNKNPKVAMNGKTSEYKINLNYTSDFDLNKVLLQEINSDNSLEVHYTNWATFENERFPQSVKILIKGEKNSQFLIENTKFDFSNIQTPYSVPNGYTKVNMK